MSRAEPYIPPTKWSTRPRNVVKAPKEGTKARLMYDMFVANPGSLITLSLKKEKESTKYIHSQVTSLIDGYGLDIRKYSEKTAYCVYVLAGRHHGVRYEDYMPAAWGNNHQMPLREVG